MMIDFQGWKGWKLSHGDVSVILVPSLGGRIMSLTFQDHELFFIQQEHASETFDFSSVDDLALAKKNLGFRLWGGNKTWVAPQSEWMLGMPPLELDAGEYDLSWKGSVAVMQSHICRETNLQ